MNSVKQWLTRALAVVGFIVILAIGMWGSVQVVRTMPSVASAIASAVVSITSIFIPAGEKIVLATQSTTVPSGETFTLSWTHEKKSNEGSYTFRYDCADGLSFASPDASGRMITVYCNTPFNFLNGGDTITLVASSTQYQMIDATLVIDFTPNGASRPTVTGTHTVTITNTKAVTETPAGTGSTGGTGTKTPGTKTETVEVFGGAAASNPNGSVDLTARVIEVGLVDKTTGAFTPTTTPSRSLSTARVGVRFEVVNNGSKTSPQWSFNAVLPTYPSHIYSSPMQQALAPGDRIEFTIGFDSFVQSDTGELILNIDPTGRVLEPNKTNNIIKYTIRVAP